MFEIERTEFDRVRMRGRFDAAQEEKAQRVFDRIDTSCRIDFEELTYISSLGLGLLVALQQRLAERGEEVVLVNVNPHIRELLKLSGLDTVITIE